MGRRRSSRLSLFSSLIASLMLLASLPSTLLSAVHLDIILRLVLAALLGASVGFNADRRRRPAGMRLYATVSVLGSLMTQIAGHADGQGAPLVLAAALLGCSFIVGLICLGLILRQASHAKATPGLTVAASLALVAVLGIATGRSLWALALIGCGLALVLLKGGRYLKDRSPYLENPR